MDTPGRGRQGRAQERVPDSNISPIAKPEATEVAHNEGTVSVMEEFAQEVPCTDLDSRVLWEERTSEAGVGVWGGLSESWVRGSEGGAGALDSCILREEWAGGPESWIWVVRTSEVTEPQSSESWPRAQGHACVCLRLPPATAAMGTQLLRLYGTAIGSPCRCPWR